MRILNIIAQKPMSTGSGTYLTELTRVIGEEGHTQAVVAGVYKDDRVELPEGVKVYPVYFNTEELPFNIVGMSDEMPYPSTRYADMTKEMQERFEKAFLRVIDEAVSDINPEIILCHHLYYLTGLVRERFPGRKVYGFCHNTDIRQMEKHSLKRDFIIENIRKLDKIFAPQAAQAEGVMKTYGIEREKITLVGVGYNHSLFNTNGRAKGDDITRLLFIGKVSQKKGVASLIRSLEFLDMPEDRLILTVVGGAGNTEELSEIKELGEKCKYKVVFTGRITNEEIREAYLTNDIFVLPSFYDAIPLVVIEALACGAKVVVTELAGVHEFFDLNAKEANIKYVELPRLKNVDEPVDEELPDFE